MAVNGHDYHLQNFNQYQSEVDNHQMEVEEDTSFDRQLIQVVKQYPGLYDKSAIGVLKGNDAWQKVAETMNETVDKCCGRFKSLRDYFNKEKKKRASGKKGKMAYYDEMSFLSPFIKTRQRNSVGSSKMSQTTSKHSDMTYDSEGRLEDIETCTVTNTEEYDLTSQLVNNNQTSISFMAKHGVRAYGDNTLELPWIISASPGSQKENTLTDGLADNIGEDNEELDSINPDIDAVERAKTYFAKKQNNPTENTKKNEQEKELFSKRNKAFTDMVIADLKTIKDREEKNTVIWKIMTVMYNKKYAKEAFKNNPDDY